MISQEYDSRSKRYSITFDNGLSFSSSVPDGYVGPGPVQLVLPEAKAQEASLYLEDQPLEHDATCYLEEPGIYRLKAGDSTLSFAICTATGSMDIYPAPRGTHFAEASLEGEPLSLDSEAYVLMKGDGQYHLVLEGEAGERFNVGIRKDTRPPEVSVAVRGGSAVIQYLSEDIKEVLLEKDGEPVEGFHANSITKPGRYRLTVTDEAGNETVTDFVLKYRVNAYGITAAVLVILVIAGGVAFVVHTKKTVKIR